MDTDPFNEQDSTVFSSEFADKSELTARLTPLSFSCTVRNQTTLGVYPIAVNLSETGGMANTTCQNGAPGVPPILMGVCVPKKGSEGYINDMKPDYFEQIYATINAQPNATYPTGTREYIIANTSSTHEALQNKTGHVFLYGNLSSNPIIQSVIVILRDLGSNHSYMALGETYSDNSTFGQFYVRPPIQIFPHTLAEDKSTFLQAARWQCPPEFVEHVDFMATLMLENLLLKTMRSVGSNGPFYTSQTQEATEITHSLSYCI